MEFKISDVTTRCIAVFLVYWFLLSTLGMIIAMGNVGYHNDRSWRDAATPLNPCFYAGEDKAITPIVLIVWLFCLPAVIVWGGILWILIAIIKILIPILTFKLATCGVAGAIC